MTKLKLKNLFRLDVDLGEFLDVGEGPNGYRRIIPIIGGRFYGAIHGEILHGGADWNLVRPDGTVFLWARYTLKTEDGELIMITNEGFQPGDPDTMAKILSNQPFDADKWYARTRPVFEVATNSKYAWLNSKVFIGNLLPPSGAGKVSIEISEVL
jgi:hypothetical protein